MTGRSKPELVTLGLRVILQLWPLWVFWWAWNLADAFGGDALNGLAPVQFLNHTLLSRASALSAQPVIALLGPIAVMLAAIALHRNRLGSRAMAYAGIAGVALSALLTLVPDAVYLWPYAVAPEYSIRTVIAAVLPSHAYALAVGILAAFIGFCLADLPP